METVPNTVVAGFMMHDMAMDPIGWAAGICCFVVVPGGISNALLETSQVFLANGKLWVSTDLAV